MNLAAKLQGQDRLCEEFLGRIQDQLLSVGRDGHQEDGYTTFNVLRSPKYQHAVKEKGDRELVLADDIPPPVISANPPPTSSGPEHQQTSTQRICSRSELRGDEPIEELIRTCTSWYVPDVHPDSSSYKPDSAVARDYSIFLAHGDPEILRKAYREMQEVKPSGGSRRVRSSGDPFRVYDSPTYDDSWETHLPRGTVIIREERQGAAGFLAVAGVVVVS